MQTEELAALPLGLSIAVGFLSTAILVVNNVRDLETDRRAGKNTSAVRMGRANAVNMYKVLIVASYVLLPFTIWAGNCEWWPLIGLLSAPLAIKPIRAMETRTDGPALNGALAATGALLAAYSVLVTIGLLLSV